ncbi:MAG: PspA/IM30 family protein [Chloroflexi bacterium]|nr:PspA/IM30 family protein [Chloroflexota bacterium]
MSVWSRIKFLFSIKSNVALNRAEDPRQVWEYAYKQQQKFLGKVRKGLIEVSTSKQQLQQQIQSQGNRIPKLEKQARRAIDAGREDLARIALQRKQTVMVELEGLEQHREGISMEERKLITAEQQIVARIETFRTRRQILSARYSAAEAQVQINETLSGVSDELGELSMALGRAEEKTQHMLARAAALDTLIEMGALDALPNGEDRLERELHEVTSTGAVEEELALLKAGQPVTLDNLPKVFN